MYLQCGEWGYLTTNLSNRRPFYFWHRWSTCKQISGFVKFLDNLGSSTSRDFYFWWQYVPTWLFLPILKLFKSPTFSVFLCSAMGIALDNWPEGPEFEYSMSFCLYEWQCILKSWFFAPKLNFCLSFSSRTHAKILYL